MIETTEDLLVEELRDLYDAEQLLVKTLPKMTKASGDSELESALSEHLEQTRQQVERLEQAFEFLTARPQRKPCKGMRGIIEEGMEGMEEDVAPGLSDSLILGAGQRVEHYEIGSYENAIGLAESAGRKEVAGLLKETLDEERDASKRLLTIARRLMKAQRGSARSREEEPASPARGRRTGGRGRSGRAVSRTRASRGTGRGSSKAGSEVTTDHEFIREWAEERGARPACVRGTGGRGDIGMLRLDFPGYSGGQSLQPISWDDWFRKFDERGLALLYQERTAGGQKSNFNKLVSRTESGSRRRAGNRRKPATRARRAGG